MDVLSELDRERTRRAELEAEIRALKEAASVAKQAQVDKLRIEKQQQVKLLTSTTAAAIKKEKEQVKKQEKTTIVDSKISQQQQMPVGKRELIAMQTERDGYKDLVDVLTADNDAISASISSRNRTLPLHIVRMLELMPYDPRAVQACKANEEVRVILLVHCIASA